MVGKIGFGGGCHWCTEAVFLSLIGVTKVEQGWIASDGINDSFSEAVIVHFDNQEIELAVLTAIHMYTHSCTSDHAMRHKYRSALYTFSSEQYEDAKLIIRKLQTDFSKKIITQVIAFVEFKENIEKYQSYYLKNRNNQFCQTYIHPKFKIIMEQFSAHVDRSRIEI